jgi:hypothetical protein
MGEVTKFDANTKLYSSQNKIIFDMIPVFDENDAIVNLITFTCF